MRILYVMPYAPRVRGLNFIKELAKKHEVDLVSITTNAQESKNLECVAHFCHTVREFKIPAWRSLLNCAIALPSPIPLQVAYCYSSSLVRALVKMIEDDSYDIVHVEMIRAAYVIRHVRHMVPTVYDSVDSRTVYLRQLARTRKNPFAKLLAIEELLKMKRYEAKICRRATRVIVISEEDRQAIRALGLTLDATVVNNGVAIRKTQPAMKRQGNKVIFLGRMRYYANIDAVLNFYRTTWPLILTGCPDAHFLVVGMNPPKKISDLGKDPSVTVTGYVEDVQLYIDTAKVAVCPIRLGVGVQNKILEAMESALPVVATPLGCEGIVVTPGQDILVGANPREFASAVIALLCDKDLNRRIGENGRRYVETNHRWTKQCELLEGLYSKEIGIAHSHITSLKASSTPV